MGSLQHPACWAVASFLKDLALLLGFCDLTSPWVCDLYPRGWEAIHRASHGTLTSGFRCGPWGRQGRPFCWLPLEGRGLSHDWDKACPGVPSQPWPGPAPPWRRKAGDGSFFLRAPASWRGGASQRSVAAHSLLMQPWAALLSSSIGMENPVWFPSCRDSALRLPGPWWVAGEGSVPT